MTRRLTRMTEDAPMNEDTAPAFIEVEPDGFKSLMNCNPDDFRRAEALARERGDAAEMRRVREAAELRYEGPWSERYQWSDEEHS